MLAFVHIDQGRNRKSAAFADFLAGAHHRACRPNFEVRPKELRQCVDRRSLLASGNVSRWCPWTSRRSLMKMSVGVLDHYNVSTRKLDETLHFYENVLGFTNGPRPPFNFPGSTAAAIPCCTSTTSRRPVSSSGAIQVSSIMLLSAAAASKRRSSVSPRMESPIM